MKESDLVGWFGWGLFVLLVVFVLAILGALLLLLFLLLLLLFLLRRLGLLVLLVVVLLALVGADHPGGCCRNIEGEGGCGRDDRRGLPQLPAIHQARKRLVHHQRRVLRLCNGVQVARSPRSRHQRWRRTRVPQTAPNRTFEKKKRYHRWWRRRRRSGNKTNRSHSMCSTQNKDYFPLLSVNNLFFLSGDCVDRSNGVVWCLYFWFLSFFLFLCGTNYRHILTRH